MKERNLKKLLTLSFYGKKIYDKELNDLLKKLNTKEDFSGDISQEVSDFLFNFKFQNKELEALTEISDWMVSMQQIKKICPGFDGEDSLFPINSFEDIPNFPNLEKFSWHDHYNNIDTTPLLACKKLKEIVLAHTEKNEKEIKKLLDGGYQIVSAIQHGEIKLAKE